MKKKTPWRTQISELTTLVAFKNMLDKLNTMKFKNNKIIALYNHSIWFIHEKKSTR